MRTNETPYTENTNNIMTKTIITPRAEKNLTSLPEWLKEYKQGLGTDESQLLKKIQEQLSKLTEEQKTKRLKQVNDRLDELEQENS